MAWGFLAKLAAKGLTKQVAKRVAIAGAKQLAKQGMYAGASFGLSKLFGEGKKKTNFDCSRQKKKKK